MFCAAAERENPDVSVYLCPSREGSDTTRKRSSNIHLMHPQVDVRRPRLGVLGILGVGRVVFQSATLLQVGLELLSASPGDRETKG